MLNESCTDKIANGSACFDVRYAEKLKVIRLIYNLFAFKKAFNSVLSSLCEAEVDHSSSEIGQKNSVASLYPEVSDRLFCQRDNRSI